MDYIYFTGQILLAIILGGAIGWQREHIGKAAGPRTYALVTMGSTLFTVLSIHAFISAGSDPGRVAAQIIVGIGFIGAGTILHKKGTIEGLTTAAGLWVAAAIGMAIGAGWLMAATIVAVMVLIILLINDGKVFRRKENLIDKKRNDK